MASVAEVVAMPFAPADALAERCRSTLGSMTVASGCFGDATPVASQAEVS